MSLASADDEPEEDENFLVAATVFFTGTTWACVEEGIDVGEYDEELELPDECTILRVPERARADFGLEITVAVVCKCREPREGDVIGLMTGEVRVWGSSEEEEEDEDEEEGRAKGVGRECGECATCGEEVATVWRERDGARSGEATASVPCCVVVLDPNHPW